MDNKPKPTQGQGKTRIRLKELFENEAFIREWKEIKAIPNEKKRNKKYWALMEKYSIDSETSLFLGELLQMNMTNYINSLEKKLTQLMLDWVIFRTLKIITI